MTPHDSRRRPNSGATAPQPPDNPRGPPRGFCNERSPGPLNSRRLLKAGEAIREVVSTAILTELRDPRVQNVTVIAVEVMPDMREAKVLVSVMGSPTQQKTALRGLQNSAGFLQSKIAERIDTRYTPRLSFRLDEGVKKSFAVAEILEKIAAENAASDAADASDAAETDELEKTGASDAVADKSVTSASDADADADEPRDD